MLRISPENEAHNTVSQSDNDAFNTTTLVCFDFKITVLKTVIKKSKIYNDKSECFEVYTLHINNSVWNQLNKLWKSLGALIIHGFHWPVESGIERSMEIYKRKDIMKVQAKDMK